MCGYTKLGRFFLKQHHACLVFFKQDTTDKHGSFKITRLSRRNELCQVTACSRLFCHFSPSVQSSNQNCFKSSGRTAKCRNLPPICISSKLPPSHVSRQNCSILRDWFHYRDSPSKTAVFSPTQLRVRFCSNSNHNNWKTAVFFTCENAKWFSRCSTCNFQRNEQSRTNISLWRELNAVLFATNMGMFPNSAIQPVGNFAGLKTMFVAHLHTIRKYSSPADK